MNKNNKKEKLPPISEIMMMSDELLGGVEIYITNNTKDIKSSPTESSDLEEGGFTTAYMIKKARKDLGLSESEDWEKEVEELFVEGNIRFKGVAKASPESITNLIKSLLQDQRNKLIEKVEGMKKDDTFGTGEIRTKTEYQMLGERMGYNQALEDVKSQLLKKPLQD